MPEPELTPLNYHVAEVELIYKTKVKPSLRPKITESRVTHGILKQIWNDNHVELREEFLLLLVNRANKLLGVWPVSQGGVAGTVADPKLIFVAALKGLASGIIVAHNHPSGNLSPSQSDIDLTKKLKEAGKFLEIKLLDHIIYTVEGYFSFADEGLL